MSSLVRPLAAAYKGVTDNSTQRPTHGLGTHAVTDLLEAVDTGDIPRATYEVHAW
jgi:hypothetical protein